MAIVVDLYLYMLVYLDILVDHTVFIPFFLFMHFGLPRVITSDQGSEFNNELNSELSQLLGIDNRLATPYHPQVIYLFVHVFNYS